MWTETHGKRMTYASNVFPFMFHICCHMTYEFASMPTDHKRVLKGNHIIHLATFPKHILLFTPYTQESCNLLSMNIFHTSHCLLLIFNPCLDVKFWGNFPHCLAGWFPYEHLLVTYYTINIYNKCIACFPDAIWIPQKRNVMYCIYGFISGT